MCDAMFAFAGEAAKLSAASFFPRAWLLQHHYGSLIRGTWAERRAKRRYDKESIGRSSTSKAEQRSSSDGDGVGKYARNGPRLIPVEGCTAFLKGHEAIQRVAREGAGFFAPVGGMRQVTFPPACKFVGFFPSA